MQTRVLLSLLTMGFLGCAPLQGPAVNLTTIATPDPIPEQMRPPPALTPPVTPGTWKAWIPRYVSREGEVTDGHWQSLSLAPPVIEEMEPDKPMPRAPKTPMQKPQSSTATKGHEQTPALVAPTPVFPQGVPQQGGMLQGQVPAHSRPLLGGQ
jgi:hypothetical protein